MVHYEQEHLYFHGLRYMATFAEEAPQPYAQCYGWVMPPEFHFASLAEVTAYS